MSGEELPKLGWKDWVALAIAAVETVFLPIIILIVILLVLVFAVDLHFASIAFLAVKSMS